MKPQNYFTGKVVVITGGSGGIGKTLANLLAGYGSSVILLARNTERLRDAVEEVKQSATGGTPPIEGISLDVTEAQKVNEVIGQIIGRHKRIDCLINSAGISQSGYAASLTLEDYHHLMEVNFYGTLNMIQAVLPDMMSRKSGHITNMGSTLSLCGTFGFSSYAASKFAVAGLAEVLRAELKPRGIRMSQVITGYVDTPMYRTTLPLEPPETRAITHFGSVLPAARVARKTVRGMAAGKFLIYANFEAWLFPWLGRFLPRMTQRILDLEASRGGASAKK